MLHVTHIVGQSIDLTNGQETPAGLIVANVHGSQVLIPMPESKLREVMDLWMESVPAELQKPSTETRTENPHQATAAEYKLVQPEARPNGRAAPARAPQVSTEFADPVSGVEAA